MITICAGTQAHGSHYRNLVRQLRRASSSGYGMCARNLTCLNSLKERGIAAEAGSLFVYRSLSLKPDEPNQLCVVSTSYVGHRSWKYYQVGGDSEFSLYTLGTSGQM